MDHLRSRILRAAVLLACFSFVISGCGKKKEEKKEIIRPVKTVLVQGPQEYVRNYPGKVQGSQRVEMSFRQVSGPLIELPVKEGDQVTKGQLLAKIDPRDYRIAYTKAKAEYDKAESDYNRYMALYEEDAVPLADLELNRANRDVAKSRLDDATAALKDTELKAPFEGLIGKRYVENFQEVMANQPIVNLQDISKVEVVIDLPEGLVALMGKEEKDDPYELFATFDTAPDKKYPLKLKEFAAKADPTTQTYRATFIMDQPKDIAVLPGMTSTVRAEMKPGAESDLAVIALPSSAVFTEADGGSYVWIVDPENNTVHARKVELGGLFGKNSIQTKSGVKMGDRVVTAGVNTLREGMKVHLIDESSAKIVD